MTDDNKQRMADLVEGLRAPPGEDGTPMHDSKSDEETGPTTGADVENFLGDESDVIIEFPTPEYDPLDFDVFRPRR